MNHELRTLLEDADDHGITMTVRISSSNATVWHGELHWFPEPERGIALTAIGPSPGAVIDQLVTEFENYQEEVELAKILLGQSLN